MSGLIRLFDLLAARLAGRFLSLTILASCLLLGIVVLYISGTTRRRRLASLRHEEDVDTFVAYLVSFGFDDGIARSTYDYLVNEESISFPIRHSDRLNRDLRISEAEVDRMVENLLRINGRECPPGTRPASFLTVEDVLRHIQSCPAIVARSPGTHADANSLRAAV